MLAYALIPDVKLFELQPVSAPGVMVARKTI